MKTFILVCLFAAVFAEPEAKPDAQFFYGNTLGYGYGYAAPYAGYSAYSAYPYSYGSYGYGHLIGKRDAEAKPEADPQLLYGNTLGYGYGYAAPYAGYSAYSSAYSYPYTYGYGAHLIGKREAEAKPEAEADAQFFYSNALGYNYAAAPYAYSAYAAAPYAYSSYAAPLAYSAAAVIPRYYANSAGVEHIVAKREAEAEPQFYSYSPYSAGYYGSYYSSPYSYAPYAAYSGYRYF